MRVLADLHHTSLYRSLVSLFEDRLGMEVYRPIGLEWWEQGYWAVHPAQDTAEQFLGLHQGYRPSDGTPPLNTFWEDQSNVPDGVYLVNDHESPTRPGRACTLDYFSSVKFDYVIASMPQHLNPFMELVEDRQPDSTFIFQVGNAWNINSLPGINLLASLSPRPTNANAVFYHQEFDLNAFYPEDIKPTGRVSSYINILQGTDGWKDFTHLENSAYLRDSLSDWRSYGGQCRDGCINGSESIAASMRASEMVFHVKPGGDGYGHSLHNAYAVGRPVITRRSHYANSWGSELMAHGTCIDLDEYWSLDDAALDLARLVSCDREELVAMGRAARARFKEIVDFDAEESMIRKWLETCRPGVGNV